MLLGLSIARAEITSPGNNYGKFFEVIILALSYFCMMLISIPTAVRSVRIAGKSKSVDIWGGCLGRKLVLCAVFSRLYVVVKLVIPIVALLCSAQAIACKVAPNIYDLRAFLDSPPRNAAVFAGRVTSVSPSRTTDDSQTYEMTVTTERWWRGRPRKQVVVTSRTGTMRGTDCEGLFDFVAHIGSTVLIVGEDNDNEVHAWGALSRVVNPKAMPHELELAH